MAWSSEFLDYLAQRQVSLRYVLQTRPMYLEPGVPWMTASHPDVIGLSVGIDPLSIRVEGGRLTPRGWSSSIGAWSVDLIGNIDMLSTSIARGTIVELLAGAPGWAWGDFQTIAVGQVRNVRGVKPRWTLEVWDLMSAVRQRLVSAGASLEGYFDDIGDTTTIATSNYTAGDGTLNVTSAANFERQTSGTGLLKITPTVGSPFYLSYTGKTGTTFTGCSATGKLATVAVDAVIGNTVTEYAYLYGHPLDIARKFMCSMAGTGYNGTYDVLPSGWGMAILGRYVDDDDIDAYRSLIVYAASGSYSWDVAVSGPVTDGYAWLVGILEAAGLYLTQRQGLLTVRGGQATRVLERGIVLTIGDEDIIEVLDYEAYDSSHDPEYTVVISRGGTATGDDSADEPDTATLPAQRQFIIEQPWLFDNELVCAQNTLARLEETYRSIPERLVLRLAGLWFARLVNGDPINLSCTKTHSRRDGVAGWVGRVAIVDQVEAEWAGCSTVVGLLIYPESEDQFA